MGPLLFLISLLVLTSGSAFALTPDELLLIVNKNAPAGRSLADGYARDRHVPDGRIVELDLPANTDDLSWLDYETKVVAPLRAYLESHDLAAKVKCLTTFYGVPLRVGATPSTPETRAEIAWLSAEQGRIDAALSPFADSLEQAAKKFAPAVDLLPTPPGQPADVKLTALGRVERAARVLTAVAEREPDKREAVTMQVNDWSAQVSAAVAALPPEPASFSDHASPTVAGTTTTPTTAPARIDPAALNALQTRRYDPDARRQLRAAARQASPFLYAQFVAGQAAYLVPDDSAAALDSELAYLWTGLYPRTHWQTNPLYRTALPVGPQTILMTARLDGPTPDVVRRMIADSIRAEAVGLNGSFVIDSRGIPARKPDGSPDPYGTFDEQLRELSRNFKTKTKFDIQFDQRPEVIRAGLMKNVALYVGWYSVGNYIPSCRFVPGAVAYHVASFEAVNVHGKDDRGWVRGLLNDGAAASIGPVAEPYLAAFPTPNDFFPLLVRGDLTLAEAYWRSVPLASWQMTLFGDPLYRPFKANPVAFPSK